MMNGSTPPTEKTPKWETGAMIVSFALVWAYFLAFQGARRENLALHFSWKIALLVAVGALIFIFVRRVRRIVAALDFQKQSENKRR